MVILREQHIFDEKFLPIFRKYKPKKSKILTPNLRMDVNNTSFREDGSRRYHG